ncbi:hypothetical protein Trydic_g15005, partial [Trypoxylus dichotomus]
MQHKEELAPVADTPSNAERKGKTDLPALKAELQHLDSSCKSVKVQLQPQSEKAIQSISELSDSLRAFSETVSILEEVTEEQVSPTLLKNTLELITQLEEPMRLMTAAVNSNIVKPQTAIFLENKSELSSAVKLLKQSLEKISTSSDAQMLQIVMEPVQVLQGQISQIQEQLEDKRQEVVIVEEKGRITLPKLKAELEHLDSNCKSVKVQLQPESEKAMQSIAELLDSLITLKETVLLLEDITEDEVPSLLLKTTLEKVTQLEEPIKLMAIAVESAIVKPQSASLLKGNKELSSAVKLLKENLNQISLSSNTQVMEIVMEPIHVLQAQISQIQEQLEYESAGDTSKEGIPSATEPTPESGKALPALKAELDRLYSTCKSVKVQLQPQSEKAILSIAELSDSLKVLKETISLVEDVTEDQISPILLENTLDQIKKLEQPIKLMATAIDSTIVEPQVAILSKDNKELLSSVKLLKENLQRISSFSDREVMQIVMEPVQTLQAQISLIQEQIETVPPPPESGLGSEEKVKTTLPALKAELQHLDSSCKQVKVQLQPNSEQALQSIAELSESLNTFQETVSLLEQVAEDEMSPLLLENTLTQLIQLEEPIKLMAATIEGTVLKPQTAVLLKDNKELTSAVKLLKQNLDKISTSPDSQIMQVVMEPVQVLQAKISQIQEQMEHEEGILVLSEAVLLPEKEIKSAIPTLKVELQNLDTTCKFVKAQLQPQSEKAVQSIAQLSDSLNTLQETVSLLEEITEDQVSPLLLNTTLQQLIQLGNPLKLMTTAIKTTILESQSPVMLKENKELLSSVKALKENLEKIASSDIQVMQIVVEPVQALHAQITQLQEQIEVEPFKVDGAKVYSLIDELSANLQGLKTHINTLKYDKIQALRLIAEVGGLFSMLKSELVVTESDKSVSQGSLNKLFSDVLSMDEALNKLCGVVADLNKLTEISQETEASLVESIKNLLVAIHKVPSQKVGIINTITNDVSSKLMEALHVIKTYKQSRLILENAKTTIKQLADNAQKVKSVDVQTQQHIVQISNISEPLLDVSSALESLQKQEEMPTEMLNELAQKFIAVEQPAAKLIAQVSNLLSPAAGTLVKEEVPLQTFEIFSSLKEIQSSIQSAIISGESQEVKSVNEALQRVVAAIDASLEVVRKETLLPVAKIKGDIQKIQENIRKIEVNLQVDSANVPYIKLLEPFAVLKATLATIESADVVEVLPTVLSLKENLSVFDDAVNSLGFVTEDITSTVTTTTELVDKNTRILFPLTQIKNSIEEMKLPKIETISNIGKPLQVLNQKVLEVINDINNQTEIKNRLEKIESSCQDLVSKLESPQLKEFESKPEKAIVSFNKLSQPAQNLRNVISELEIHALEDDVQKFSDKLTHSQEPIETVSAIVENISASITNETSMDQLQSTELLNVLKDVKAKIENIPITESENKHITEVNKALEVFSSTLNEIYNNLQEAKDLAALEILEGSTDIKANIMKINEQIPKAGINLNTILFAGVAKSLDDLKVGLSFGNCKPEEAETMLEPIKSINEKLKVLLEPLDELNNAVTELASVKLADSKPSKLKLIKVFNDIQDSIKNITLSEVETQYLNRGMLSNLNIQLKESVDALNEDLQVQEQLR